MASYKFNATMRGQAHAGYVNAMLIDSDTFSGIMWAAVLVGIVIATYFARRRRRRRTERLRMMELLKRYSQGGMPADELGQRAQEMTDGRFVQSTEFYSLVVAAFQRAKLEHRPHSREDERKLLSLLAALKNEFGLTDRYQIEAWRAGRE